MQQNPNPYPYQPPPPAPPKKKMSGCLLALLVGVAALPVCGGIGAAVAIPAYVRYIRRAKSTEAVDRLAYLYRAMGTYYAEYRTLPPSTPLSPASVPAGQRVIDPPGTWSHPTWQALNFTLSDPHYYSYQIVSDGQTFTARAVGDLDGNGVTSTFERAGQVTPAGGIQGSQGVWMARELE